MGPAVVIPETESTQINPANPPVSEEIEVTIDNDVPETKFRHQPEYRTEYADIACRLKAADFTDQDVAYALGVSLSTIASWKYKYESFKRACEDGRREQKKRIVARAMKMALGYRYTEKNVKHSYDKDGNLTRTEESEFHKENTGNERLLVFMLINMDRQLKDNEWQASNKIEVTESKSVSINIDGKSAKEQIKRLSGDLLTNGLDGPLG